MNQKGFAPIIATFVVLIGIVLAVYLTLHTQIFRPHAASDVTRAEFVNANGDVITQTSSRNVIVRLIYVPESVPQPVNNQGTTNFGSGGTVTVPGGSVSVSGSSNVTSTGNGSVNVQFTGPSASVGGGSATSTSSYQSYAQNTTTVTQNGQTTTTTNTTGSPTTAQPGQFPTSFRIANSLGELVTAQSQTFTQNEQEVNWLLGSGDGLKQVFVQFEVNGNWQPPVTVSITLNTAGSVNQNLPRSSGNPAGAGQTNLTNGNKAFFILQQGAPVQVSTNTGSSSSGSTSGTGTSNPAVGIQQVPQSRNGTGVITQIPVKVLAQSDTAAANLFNVKLTFDPSAIQAAWVDTHGSFVVNWVSNTFDNSAGIITLTGGVPNPGIQTSGQPKLMATVYFVMLKNSPLTVNIDPASGIFANSNNFNILSQGQGLNLTPPGVATPPIEVASPHPTSVPVPSLMPTSLPTPQPTQISSGGPGASVPAGSPGSGGGSSCTIDAPHFANTAQSVPSDSVVTVTVTGSAGCSGKTVDFGVNQDNGFLGSQPVTDPPPPATFNGNTAASVWVTKSNNGNLGGILGPSGYSLSASLPDTNQITKADQELKVAKQLLQGFKKGDINHDGSITLEDLSAFFSDFYKNNAPTEADFNGDGVVNAFDFSSFISLLKQQGVIPASQ